MKESRRKFLWQVGGGLAGLTGLLKLAKAMSAQESVATLEEPCSTVPWDCPTSYTCDKLGGIACQNKFNCITTFTCGPTWFGDFKCEQLEFSCGSFECKTYGGEPGAQFHCLANFNYCNSFECDPGDFSCEIPKHYKCLNNEPAYSCSASVGTLSTAYAASISPPEP